MKVLLEPFDDRTQDWLFYISACTAVILAALYLSGIDFSDFLPGCYIYGRYHIYCPGCGGTRAVRSLLGGDFVQSFLYHPFVPYAAVVYILFLCSNVLYRLRAVKKRFLLRPVYLLAAVAIIIGQCAVKNLLILL